MSRNPEPCLCGDPECWRCFPQDMGEDEERMARAMADVTGSHEADCECATCRPDWPTVTPDELEKLIAEDDRRREG